MGTNYYQRVDPCPCCKLSKEVRHIGKSSGGWCFSLHVYPHEGINNLEDWFSILKEGEVFDEYGDQVSLDFLRSAICDRVRTTMPWDHEMLARNHAILGPNNLTRYAIGRNCIGHGEGTYDYIVGEFS